MTEDQLRKITGIKDAVKLHSLLFGINNTAAKFNINTPLRLSHFISQVQHESQNFTATVENLNYGVVGLMDTFAKYFPHENVAKIYARKPEKIANKVYANRNGNGNEASGDGWRYRGRGYLQITGESNYAAITKELGTDFINHPELLQTPQYAILSAGSWWNSHNLNSVADKAEKPDMGVTAVTKVVNGGTNGLAERRKLFNSAYKMLNS